MASRRFISYLRVSTQRQGISGLGLEAQREAVAQYLNGGSWKLVGEIVEVETGRKAERPKLTEALSLCRLHGATLVIAKLDRLARNVAFVASLMDSGVEFVACDFPQANRLTVHILAAVAEHEASMISARTKAALAAAKARGRRLGNPANLSNTDVGRERGTAARVLTTDARAAALLPVLESIRADGASSLRAIAAELNARSIPSARGGTWSANSVRRVFRRALTP